VLNGESPFVIANIGLVHNIFGVGIGAGAIIPVVRIEDHILLGSFSSAPEVDRRLARKSTVLDCE
jgi:hypothetical protein